MNFFPGNGDRQQVWVSSGQLSSEEPKGSGNEGDLPTYYKTQVPSWGSGTTPADSARPNDRQSTEFSGVEPGLALEASTDPGSLPRKSSGSFFPTSDGARTPLSFATDDGEAPGPLESGSTRKFGFTPGFSTYPIIKPPPTASGS